MLKKKKILLVNHCLDLGGGEKLIFEICGFLSQNKLIPEVLILNNLESEFYDEILEKMNIKVKRIKLLTRNELIFGLLKKDFFWNLKFRFFPYLFYKKIHFFNLTTTGPFHSGIYHNSKFFWHIGNQIQYPNKKTNFQESIFINKKHTCVCINKYQVQELRKSFPDLTCKINVVKLFTNEHG